MPKLESNTYLTVFEDSTCLIPNPKWDGDKPNTHYYQQIVLKKDVGMMLTGDVTYTVVRNKIPVEEVEN